MPGKVVDGRQFKRSPTQLARDGAMIARLHYQGFTDQEIADVLNDRPGVLYTISRRTVTSQRNQMKKRWQEEAEEETERWIAEAVAELNAVRMSAWEAYQKSLEPAQKKKVTTGMVDDKAIDKLEEWEEQRIGDTSQLQIIIQATKEINKLRGLYEMKLRIDQHTYSEHVVKTYHTSVSPDQWDDPNIQVIDGEVKQLTGDNGQEST